MAFEFSGLVCLPWGSGRALAWTRGSLLVLVAVALGVASCANQRDELLKERCAQLANLGYIDNGRIVALLRVNGQPVMGDEQSLRRAAKQFCGAHG